MRGGDFTHDHDHAGRAAALAGHSAVGVVRHDFIQHGVGDAVAHLVRVALGDGLRCEQVLTHGSLLPSFSGRSRCGSRLLPSAEPSARPAGRRP